MPVAVTMLRNQRRLLLLHVHSGHHFINSTMRSVLAALALTSLCAALAFAAPLPPAAHAEVLTLLGRLESSGCHFNRNGNWYSGAEAKAHLARKLDYLEGKGALQSAEQFIELGASASSSSGKDYQVKCGAAEATPSAIWLRGQLQQMRSGAKP
jgi:hypothetical protein